MNEGRECRICLIGDEEEELIQPCRCSTAFVHESCLQKWREENRDNEKYNQCEICKADYIVHRRFPKETFTSSSSGISSNTLSLPSLLQSTKTFTGCSSGNSSKTLSLTSLLQSAKT